MLALFLGALGVGILWALWLPGPEVKPNYTAWMATTAFCVLAALMASTWAHSRYVDVWVAAAAAGALVYRAFLKPVGLVVASLLGAACLGHLAPPGLMPRASVALSALVLGVTLDAMVLGHWYLVQHGLSFKPLSRMSLALLAVVAARLILAAAWTWGMGGWAQVSGGPLDRRMFLLLRALLGFVGPLGLGWMVWACVRIKSNTSATGVLYVITLFVLVGEFTSAYFLASMGACL